MDTDRIIDLAVRQLVQDRERIDAEIKELMQRPRLALNPAPVVEAEIAPAPEVARPRKVREKAALPVKRAGGGARKTCKDCGVAKTPSEYGRHSAFRDGLDNRCLECRRAAAAKKRAAKPKRAVAAPPDEDENEAEPEARTAPVSAELVNLPDGPYPVNCPLCKAPCSTEARLRRHIELVHNRRAA